MVVALVGGVLPAVVAVVGGFLLANWYFTPPFYELDDRRGREPARPRRLRRRRRASSPCSSTGSGAAGCARPRLQAEAEALAALAGALARPGLGRRDARPAAGHVRVPRGRAARTRPATGWARGRRLRAPSRRRGPDDADVSRDLGRGVALALAGGTLSGEDQRVLNAFAAQVAGGRRARAAAGRGRPGRRPRRRQHAAGGAAAGRLPRPAHAAGVDQGVDLQPAPARRRLAAGRRSTSSRRRSRRRPIGSPRSSATCST